MTSEYSKAEIRIQARDAAARFEGGGEPGFFETLDLITKSKSVFSSLRTFGDEIGKRACLYPDKYFALFDRTMHRPREVSYDPAIHGSKTRSIDANISALVYGGRTAIVGSAFTRMRKEHWLRILHEIERYIIEFHEWYVVDPWCHHPMGHIIADHPSEMLAKLTEWSNHENFWFRKATGVYMHALFVDYSGREISPYLMLLDRLILDDNARVRKGVAWALREMAKNYRKELLDFIDRWIKVGNKRVNQVIRNEAIKKLDETTKKEILGRLL